MLYLCSSNMYVQQEGWGNSSPCDILAVLNSVKYEFDKLIEPQYITSRIFIVVPTNEDPMCSLHGQIHLIHLSAKDRYWSQYAFQFAHEYCHHLIESDLTGIDKPLFWFEECFCELASLFILKRMARTWSTNPPYPNWMSFSKSLDDYANERIYRKKNILDVPLSVWMHKHIAEMYKKQYQRDLYLIVAANILDLFEHYPELWNCIIYFRSGYEKEYTELKTFLDYIFETIPEKYQIPYGILKNRIY